MVAVPVEPDAPDAQQLLLDELSDPIYAQSQPSWFDLLSQSVLDWFASLSLADGTGPSALALVIGAIVIAAAIAGAILVYGLPRWRARSRLSVELLGASDRRTTRELRRDAERAAGANDFSLAIAERFRAIARALDERTIVSSVPGMTAQGFARAAAQQFPAHAAPFEVAAEHFDAVRYLGRAGTREQYDAVRELDEAIDRAPSPLVGGGAGAGVGAGAGSDAGAGATDLMRSSAR